MPQRRTRQSFDEGVAVAALALLVGDEQMHRSTKMELGPLIARALDGLGGYSAPRQHATPHRVARGNLDRGMEPITQSDGDPRFWRGLARRWWRYLNARSV